jgi:4a-hydroxytetrahydrobiopterin dehydratase
MSELLDENELESALKKCPEWEIHENTIFRSLEFEDFVEAMEFVNTVADLAEEAGHHPDLGISYSVVTLTLVTHEEGGVTSADIEMAQRLDNLID